MIRPFAISVLLVLFCVASAMAQNTAMVSGLLKDEAENPLFGATIVIKGTQGKGTTTDNNGFYELKVPADQGIIIAYSYLGMRTEEETVNLAAGETKTINLTLKFKGTDIGMFDVYAERRNSTMTPLDPEIANYIPTVGSGDISQLLVGQFVTIRNELSSSYSVRGGSFDENLIYVNDIEIYRPFLVRAGQQEGLSFPNSDMVESINFSAGGFDARYGDKLSSVLDITYKRPSTFAASARGSLLGGAISVEDASENKRFTQVHGLRYKSNQYVLNSLDVQGDYRPQFFDYQAYFTFSLTDQWELGILGHYSQNKFNFIPTTRETDFGTVNQALRLTVFFEGEELDEFRTGTGAFSLNHRSNDGNTLVKFIGSAFRTSESESFDILGQYWLDELERDLGSDGFGDVAFNRGVGSFLNHARNDLDATVINFQHKGFHTWDDTTNNVDRYFQWGAKLQTEQINDRLSEWNYVDSSGFSLPQSPSNQIVLQDVVKANISLNTTRVTGYVQNDWSFEFLPRGVNEIDTLYTDSTGRVDLIRNEKASIDLSLGVRGHLWSYNNQFVWSPRGTISYKPVWKTPKTVTDSAGKDSTFLQRRDVVFRFSTGLYNQPPFYRELRDFAGVLNPEIRAQRSAHFVLGGDYNFKLWNRPFKLVAEAYYKHLWDLIPYEVDNVRIRYFAKNNSQGYATGFDVKLNGEFVKGIPSWVSLSLLKTEEDILDDFFYDYFNSDGEKILFGFTTNDSIVDSLRVEPGRIPRNQDQRFSFSLFFQDEMPKWPTYKVHLSLLFSTGLPFGPPSNERYLDVLRTPSYRRVDIGFSKEFIGPNVKPKREREKRRIKELWVSAEVFNLLGVSNTINYLWIQDVTARYYAIPNFLTSRRLNLKVAMKF